MRPLFFGPPQHVFNGAEDTFPSCSVRPQQSRRRGQHDGLIVSRKVITRAELYARLVRDEGNLSFRDNVKTALRESTDGNSFAAILVKKEAGVREWGMEGMCKIPRARDAPWSAENARKKSCE